MIARDDSELLFGRDDSVLLFGAKPEAPGLINQPKTSEEVAAEKPAFYPKRDKSQPVDTTPVTDYKVKTDRTWGEYAQDLLAVSGSRGVVNAGASVYGLVDLASAGTAGKGFSALGGSFKKTNEAALEYLGSDKQKALEKVISKAGEGRNYIDSFVNQLQAIAQNPEYIPNALLESLPSMLLAGGGARKVAESIYAKALASSAAAGLSVAESQAAAAAAVSASTNAILWTASAGEGALAGGQIATDAREAGRTWGQYVLPAIAGGVSTAVIGRAAGLVPGFGDAEVALFTRGMGVGVATGGRALRTAKSAFQEGVFEEFPQSSSEQMFGNLAQGKPWNEGLGGAGAQGLVVGAAMGGGMGAISKNTPSPAESFAKAFEQDINDRSYAEKNIEADAISALHNANLPPLINPYDPTVEPSNPPGGTPTGGTPTGGTPTGGGKVGIFTPTPNIDGLIAAITSTDVDVDEAIDAATIAAGISVVNPVTPTPYSLLDKGYTETVRDSGARVFISEGHTVAFNPAGELMTDRTRLEPHTVTNSYLSEEPLEVKVISDNIRGKLTAFITDGQTIELSPRANKEYLDGVPIAKVLETEFSDSAGITPTGEKTPHTTTVQRTADAQTAETVTPETRPQAPAVSIDDITSLVVAKNVSGLTELTKKLTGKTQLEELTPAELGAVYDALDKNTHALPLPSYIGSINQDLYKVADVVEAAKTARNNMAISDEVNSRGIGDTPEMAMAQLEAFRAGVASQNGKLLSPNRTGATTNQLLEVWTNYHATVNDILASRRENPDMWAAYAARQTQIAEIKVGDTALTPYPSTEHPFGQPVTIVQKFARNWKVREEDGTEGLVPPSALRPANVAAGGMINTGGPAVPVGGPTAKTASTEPVVTRATPPTDPNVSWSPTVTLDYGAYTIENDGAQPTYSFKPPLTFTSKATLQQLRVTNDGARLLFTNQKEQPITISVSPDYIRMENPATGSLQDYDFGSSEDNPTLIELFGPDLLNQLDKTAAENRVPTFLDALTQQFGLANLDRFQQEYADMLDNKPLPVSGPAAAPTGGPAAAPTGGPAAAPTGGPAAAPTGGPAAAPTGGPAAAPTGGPAAPAAPTTVDTPVTPRQAKARWILDQVEQKITDAVQKTLGSVEHFISGDTVFHYTRNAADPKKLVLSSGFASDAAKTEYEQAKKVAEFNGNPMKMAIEENDAEAVAALLYGNAVENTLWPAIFPDEMLIRIPVNLDKLNDIEAALVEYKFRITDRSVPATTDNPAYVGPEQVTISALYRPAKTSIQDAGANFGGNRKGNAPTPPTPKDATDSQISKMLAAVGKDKLFDINSNPANTFGVMMFKEGVVANIIPAADYLYKVINNLIYLTKTTGTRQAIKLALQQGFQTQIETALQEYLNTANALQTIFDANANVLSLYGALQSKYVLDSSNTSRIKYTPEGTALARASASERLNAYFNDMYGAFGADENSTDQTKRIIKKDAEVPPPLGNIIRRGMRDHRQGRDVDTQDFLTTFGFFPGGISFGDWVNQAERAAHLNFVYDAMYDLADLSGVAPSILGLNEKLKLAIGAQGRGGKTAAHYISNLNEINLTKTKGDGTLGHEWHHGLDFNLRLTPNGKLLMNETVSVLRNILTADFTENNLRAILKDTANSTDNRNLPPKQAFFNAIKATYFLSGLTNVRTAFYRNALKMDEGREPYWGTSTEMLSRGFESMLFDAANGGTPYLVGPTVADGYVSPKNGYAGTTYPEGKERLQLNDVFKHMLAQIDPVTLDIKTYPIEAKVVYVEGLGYAVVDQHNLNVGYQNEYQIKWNKDESTAEEIKRDRNGSQRVFTPYAAQIAKVNERVLSMAQRIDAIMEEMNLFKWPEIKNGSMAESMFYHMRQGWWPKNNRELAEYGVKAYTQKPEMLGFNPATDTRKIDEYSVADFLADRTKGKKTQEDFEAAATRFVGQVITDMRSKGSDTKAIYDYIVTLYLSQPTLDVQSTLSKANSAYSTPIPIGFLAGMLARVLPSTTVLDSTGGNGLLTIAANPKNVTAIEIDPNRANNLTLMQIGKVITGNVLDKIADIRDQEVDVVLINPPFDTLPTPADIKSWDGRNYKISKLEQQIAALSLRAMANDGRAVLILAAQLNKPGNLTGPDIVFLNWLYGNYNVADHFEIGGDLYRKQGTTYPLRVLVIAGRNQTENVYPTDFVINRVTSFDQLWSRYVQASNNSEKIVVGTGKRGAITGGTNRPPGGVPSGNPLENGKTGNAVGVDTGVGVGGQLSEAGGLAGATGATGRGTSGGLGVAEQQSDSGDDQRGGPNGVETSGQGNGVVLRDPSENELGGLSELDFDDLLGPDIPNAPKDTATPRGPRAPIETGAPRAPRTSKGPLVLSAEFQGLGLEGILSDLTAALSGTLPKTETQNLAKEPEITSEPSNILDVVDTVAREKKQAQEALDRIAESARHNNGTYSVGDGKNYADVKPIIQRVWESLGTKFIELKERVLKLKELLVNVYGNKILPQLKMFFGELTQKVKERPKNQTPVQAEPIDTEARVVYLGKSKFGSDGIFLPRAQSQHAYTALENLEAQVGDIDAFVAKELGYTSVDDMAYGPDGRSRLAGYQIDALALAIQANKMGLGFIIGDDTGVGKGRTAAAMIVWAKANKKIPIFVTLNKTLYTAMYKDLLDIGHGDMRIGMTDEDSVVEKDLGEGNSARIFENTGKNRGGSSLVRYLTANGALPDNVDTVFTTYSQLNGGSGSLPRQSAVASLVAAGKAVLIMDEAHNAAGVTLEDKAKKSMGQNEFFMSLLTGQGLLGKDSKGELIDAPDTWNPPSAVYLSATFAKRPDNMPLYIHTNLRYAANTPQELKDLFGKGVKTDVLQQVSSEMLVESGSMLRRERSYEGVVMDFVTDTANGPRDAREVDRVTTILRSLVNADRALNDWVKSGEGQSAIMAALVPPGGRLGAAGPTAFSEAKRNVFTSVVHNYIGTLLLSVKTATAVQTTVDKMNTTYAIRKIGDELVTDTFTSKKEAEKKLAEYGSVYEIDIRGGEKVVIGLQNTNGSALDDYVSKNGIKIGDELTNFGWQTLLQRAVDSTRKINLKSATGDPKDDVKVIIPLSLMPRSVRAGYENVSEMLANFQSNLPISPIDQIRTELEKKFVWVNEDGVTQVGDAPPPGVSARNLIVREITGRTTGIDYAGDVPKYAALEKSSRVSKIFSFQNGSKSKNGPVDVLVINSAGATGISLHASVDAFDQRPRRMIILQPHGDISVFTQLLGRIHRTGQVEWPSFTMLATDIPAEKRILGMLRKKLSSLKSNTSGGSNSTVVEGVDFMNLYGDVVTAEYLNEHADIREFLKQPLFEDPEKTAGTDLAHKASGTAALLSTEDQQEYFDSIEAGYNAVIELRNATGTNALSRRILPLEAELFKENLIEEGLDSSNPFLRDVVMAQFNVDIIGMMPTPRNIADDISQALNGRTSNEVVDAIDTSLSSIFIESRNQIILKQQILTAAIAAPGATEKDVQLLDQQRIALDTQFATLNDRREKTLKALRSNYAIGSGYESFEIHDVPASAVIIGVKVDTARIGKSKTGNPYSPSNFQIMFKRNIPDGRVAPTLATLEGDTIAKKGYTTRPPTDQWFALQAATGGRTTRWIALGNILRASALYGNAGGEIAKFTLIDNPEAVSGVVMPQKYSPPAISKQPVRLRNAESAVQYVLAVWGAKLLEKYAGTQIDEYKELADKIKPLMLDGVPTFDATASSTATDSVLRGPNSVWNLELSQYRPLGFKLYISADSAHKRFATNSQIISLVPGGMAKKGKDAFYTMGKGDYITDPANVVALIKLLHKQYAAMVGPAQADFARDVMKAEFAASEAKRGMFSRNSSSSNGQTADAVRAQITDIRGIVVNVVQSVTDLPLNGAPTRTEGVWYSGTTVYLVADNLPNARRVQEVLAHEAIGHAAMETMLGPRLMGELVRNVQILEKTGSRAMKDIAAQVDRTQPNLDPVKRAKEIIAIMAERGLHTKSAVWQRAIQTIRDWLRGLGFTIKFSDRDILALLRDAETFVGGTDATTGTPIESTPYLSVQTRPRLKKLLEETDADKLREGVKKLSDDLADQANAKQVNPRVRGYDWLNERLLRALRKNEISQPQYRLAVWLLRQNPNIADGLGLSIRTKTNEIGSASYLVGPQIMRLLKNRGDDVTVAHEMLHHTERMMPENVQIGIESEWMKQIVAVLDYALKNNNTVLAGYVRLALAAAEGDSVAYKKVVTAIVDGPLSQDFYQYINPSEFWAVNASALIKAREGAQTGGWVSQAVQWIREFVSRAAEIFGLLSNSAVIRGVEAVLNAQALIPDATIIANRPLQELPSKPETQPLYSIANIQDFLYSDNELNWVKKAFGTPQHIALTSRAFKPVFDEGQRFLTDIATFANTAADEASSILPRIDRLRDVLPSVFGGLNLPKKASLNTVMDAVMQGTLYGGGSPLTGRVWTDAELQNGGPARTLTQPFSQIFAPLNDEQIKLYRETLASTNVSLDNFSKGVIHRLVRNRGVTFDREMSLDDVAQVVRDNLDTKISAQNVIILNANAGLATLLPTQVSEKLKLLNEIKNAQDKISETEKTQLAVTDVEQRATKLKEKGYFPAMRFGKFAVYLTETNPINGKTSQIYFGLFESQTKANLAAMDLRKQYPNADLTRGMLTTKQHEMFQGLSIDVVEHFADYMTDENGDPISKDPLVQGFLRAAVAERSALKRQIHRKGVAGYSTDITRVLSTFILSMARNASSNFHSAEINEAVGNVPRGDLQDYAISLAQYLKNPVEEAQALRGMLFVEYLGGSIIHGAVNMTQPMMVSAPYLKQFTTAANVYAKISAAMLPNAAGKLTGQAKTAYERAKTEGVVSPQEIHQLRAESAALPLGTSITMRKFAAAWGVVYSVTEEFNRKTTFIAAYNIAVEQNMADPYVFAKEAVDQTQFIYNKGNRPTTSRGAVGSVARTFTQFGVSYLEVAKRLYDVKDASGKSNKTPFALLLLTLLFAAGLEGLPFAEDIEDVIDTIGQWMGFATNTKKELHKFVRSVLGDVAGQIALKGVSGIPGMPFDLSQRFGMGNLIPGTTLFKPSETNKTKALLEIAGPISQFAPVEGTMMGNALDKLSKNDFFGSMIAIGPKAIQNVEKGLKMLELGYYPDAKGRRGVDTTTSEAILKMLGAQPASVARQAVIRQDIYSSLAIQKREENEIVEQWASGIAFGDFKEVASARIKMRNWNAANPDYLVVITADQLRSRVKELKIPQNVRDIKNAPKEMRGEVIRELQQ